MEKCPDQRKDVFDCLTWLIDYENSFDQLQLRETLHNTKVDEKHMRIMQNLYWKEKTRV